jgi:hypothetical protein
MHRLRHVDAREVIVCTFEAHIFCAGVRANPAQKVRKRNAAPLADGAPAFGANVAGDLVGLRHRAQFLQRPLALAGHKARDFESVVFFIHLRDFAFAVEGVEGKGRVIMEAG